MRKAIAPESPPLWDDYAVQLFPEEAPTWEARSLASAFLNNTLFNRMWSETDHLDVADSQGRPALPMYTAEWLLERYDSHRSYGYEPRFRFTLQNLYGATLRQIEKTRWRKTQFDANTSLGQANIETLEAFEGVYNNILGLVEQAIQLDASPAPGPALPGPAPVGGK